MSAPTQRRAIVEFALTLVVVLGFACASCFDSDEVPTADTDTGTESGTQ